MIVELEAGCSPLSPPSARVSQLATNCHMKQPLVTCLLVARLPQASKKTKSRCIRARGARAATNAAVRIPPTVNRQSAPLKCHMPVKAESTTAAENPEAT